MVGFERLPLHPHPFADEVENDKQLLDCLEFGMLPFLLILKLLTLLVMKENRCLVGLICDGLFHLVLEFRFRRGIHAFDIDLGDIFGLSEQSQFFEVVLEASDDSLDLFKLEFSPVLLLQVVVYFGVGTELVAGGLLDEGLGFGEGNRSAGDDVDDLSDSHVLGLI